MARVIPLFNSTFGSIPTSKSLGLAGGGGILYAEQRSPSDPFFYADVTIDNIVVGSRWMLGYTPSGGAFTELASGTASTTSVVVSNVPSYSAPMQLELRVRKASDGVKYQPLRVYTVHSPNGASFFISQVPDDIAG